MTTCVWQSSSFSDLASPFAGVLDGPFIFPVSARVSNDSLGWEAVDLSQQLKRIEQLEENWDGYGAARIEASMTQMARGLLPILSAQPDHILPSVAGTLLIEWEGLLGRASLELGQDSFSFYTAPTNGESILLGGDAQGLEVEDINFALETIAGSVQPDSLEAGDWGLGIESRA